MFTIKSSINSRGFSLLSVLISLGILSLTGLAIASFMSYFYEGAGKVEDKIVAIGLSSELRSAIELTSTCSQFIKKDTFSYPGLQGDGTIVLNTPDPGLPLHFTLDSGIVAGDVTQTSSVNINSLKIYGASLVSSYQNTKLYSGRLILSASAGKTNTTELSPFLVGMINLTVDSATNKIVGCSDSMTAYSLCSALGGKYDPNTTPICNFLKFCPAGQTLIFNASGHPVCKNIITDLSSICPGSTFFKTATIGAGTVPDVSCQGSTPPVERVVVKTTASCQTPWRNQACSMNFNYKSLLSVADQAKIVKKIKLRYFAFGNGSSPSCRIRYAPEFINGTPGSYTSGGCGSNCQQTTATLNAAGNISISSQTAGYAKNCKGNACFGCVSDVQVELEF